MVAMKNRTGIVAYPRNFTEEIKGLKRKIIALMMEKRQGTS